MPQNAPFCAFATDRQPTAEAAPNGGYGRAPSRRVADVVVPTAEHVRFAARYGVLAGLLRRV